jgi:hypothetical protein
LISNKNILFYIICGLILLPLFSVSAQGQKTHDSILVRNFVVKSYIALSGSKPLPQAIKETCRQFQLYDSFETKKGQFVDTLLNQKAFYTNLYDKYRFEYLQGTNSDLIYHDIADYKLLLTIKTQSVFFDLFTDILNKLQRLLTIEDKLQTGEISNDEALAYFLDNKFYDDINMGPDNYVISTFNYLFFRNPTKYELIEGKKMLANQTGTLFFKQGQSKEEYLSIIMSSDSYKEGRVRYWYNNLLNREPEPDEILNFISTKAFDTKTLIKNIIVSKEFTGV